MKARNVLTPPKRMKTGAIGTFQTSRILARRRRGSCKTRQTGVARLCPALVRASKENFESRRTRMSRIRKLGVFILLAILSATCFESGTAQENWCDFFTFRNEFEIESDAKVDAYIKRKDYAKAEARAKKLDFDSRALASIYAYAGKKDEAFRLFLDGVREEESEEVREFMFLEDVVLLRSVSFDLADEFYARANEQRVITVPKEELLCKELQILMLFDQMADSEKILNSLLDSSYAGEDLIDVTISFLWKIESEKEKVRTLSKTLLAKFPDSLDVKLNWIGSLASAEPQQAILELARFKKQFPDFYWDEEKSTEIQYVRENILEGKFSKLPAFFPKLVAKVYTNIIFMI
jgi:hypothetical protein